MTVTQIVFISPILERINVLNVLFKIKYLKKNMDIVKRYLLLKK